jgi:hypothetical protein
MAYILNKTDGTALVTVLDNATTSDYSVSFIGKNYLPYGETLNENLLHLLENSASVTTARPVNPLIGQTWYNKTDNTLYVCYQERAGSVPAKFRALAKSNVGSGTPVDPAAGDLWFDPVAGVLKAYAGSAKGWITIGPTPQANWTQTDSAQPDFIKNKPAAFTPDLSVKNNGTVLASRTTSINFAGPGVTASLVSGTTNSIDIKINGVSIGSTAPTAPAAGALWYENNNVGRGFIFDGNSWVDFSPQLPAAGSSAPTLPATNAVGYLYNNGSGSITWSPISSSSSAATALSALTDVDTTGVAVGNVLKYTSVGGTSKWRPAATSAPTAASTSFTLATTDGSAKSMGVVLTPGTWQVILDTRLTITNDYNHDNELTQIATVGSVTVTTSLKTNRGGGAGHGRFSHMSDVAVGEFTLTVDTPIVMAMQAAVPGTVAHTPVGSTLTVSKIASTDAQNIYSGTMPTFTVPAATGLGVGQTWKNVKHARAFAQTYTNNTGAPIMVSIGIEMLGVDVDAGIYNNSELFVNSISMGQVGDLSRGSGQLSAIVPAGGTYKVITDSTLYASIWSWAELS